MRIRMLTSEVVIEEQREMRYLGYRQRVSFWHIFQLYLWGSETNGEETYQIEVSYLQPGEVIDKWGTTDLVNVVQLPPRETDFDRFHVAYEHYREIFDRICDHEFSWTESDLCRWRCQRRGHRTRSRVVKAELA